jgi:hypothetical protein
VLPFVSAEDTSGLGDGFIGAVPGSVAVGTTGVAFVSVEAASVAAGAEVGLVVSAVAAAGSAGAEVGSDVLPDPEEADVDAGAELWSITAPDPEEAGGLAGGGVASSARTGIVNSILTMNTARNGITNSLDQFFLDILFSCQQIELLY